MPALPGYYTVAEAAERLGYASPSTIKNGCQAGKIPAYKVAKTWLIPGLGITARKGNTKRTRK